MRLLLAAICLTVLTSKSQSQSISTDRVHDFYHVTAGYGIGTVASYLGKTPTSRIVISTMSATTAGILKERYDLRNGGKFSTSDVLFTATGGLISGVVTNWIYKTAERRALRKSYRKR